MDWELLKSMELIVGDGGGDKDGNFLGFYSLFRLFRK
jgi:hypothetical protein